MPSAAFGHPSVQRTNSAPKIDSARRAGHVAALTSMSAACGWRPDAGRRNPLLNFQRFGPRARQPVSRDDDGLPTRWSAAACAWSEW